MIYNLSIFASRCFTNYWFSLRTIKRSFSKSYYDILKVSPTCSAKEIREAFLYLSKQTHPDKHLNDPSMHEKFVKLNEAYSTLINPSSRRTYDLTLYNERKLNPPYDRPYSQNYTHPRTTYDTYQSTKSSQRTNDGYYKDPFSWEHKSYTETNPGQFSSGLRGAKKFSNTVIVGLLLTITVFGAIIQFLAIRHSFVINQEQMLERSQQYSLIHKLAREKAKLYGNAHQLEVLKRRLSGSYDVENNDANVSEIKNDESIINPEDLMKNVDKGKGQITSEEQHGVPKGGKTGVCAVHGTPGQCTVHQKSNNNVNSDKSSETVTVNSPSDASKKCNKCGHKIH